MSTGLDLDAAGIAHTAAGITVNRGLRTTNRRVYAIGDVAGGPQFTHAANYHAGLVIRNALFRLPVKADDGLIPRVTFTDPELAHVGLTEDEARPRAARRSGSCAGRSPRTTAPRPSATTRGHIKVITDKGGRILGATIVGAGAGELITPWTLALANRLNIRAMAGIVVPYPTFGEIGKRAAISYFLPSLTSPFVRRIIGWVRRFGLNQRQFRDTSAIEHG